MAKIEKYATPTNLTEAAQLIATSEATLLAGGTDLMLQTQAGLRSFTPVLLNLRRIPELRGVSTNDGTIRVGALTTVTDLLNSDTLLQSAAVLPQAADQFASNQVRNSATLGGNICNASPAGDLIIPLLLLDAVVELACWADQKLATRRVPLCEFFIGPGQTSLRPDEILSAVSFAVPEPQFVARFEKFGTRPALDISVVSVGIAGVREKGCLQKVRVAFGAVSPIPMRGIKTEKVIVGQKYSDELITEAVNQAAAEVSPISDARASAWYRQEMIRVVTGRVLRDVLYTED